MSEISELKKMIADQQRTEPCFVELLQTSEELRPLKPVHMTAREAASTFRVRYRHAEQAKIPTCGTNETVKALDALPSDEKVALLNFVGVKRIFMVFVWTNPNKLIGCATIDRRNKDKIRP